MRLVIDLRFIGELSKWQADVVNVPGCEASSATAGSAVEASVQKALRQIEDSRSCDKHTCPTCATTVLA